MLLILSGCQLVPMPTSTPTASGAPTMTLTATIVPIPTITPSPSETPTAMIPKVCAPLEGLALADAQNMVVNAYNPPPPGSDDPHQGVDLAFTTGEGKVAVGGQAVYAVLSGKVAGLIQNRFPYGNVVIVEAPLSELPAGVVVPQPLGNLNPPGALSCPDYSGQADLLSNPRSVYLLYSHMASIAPLELEQAVSCGDNLGVVGQTGNALNPHLHLEVRVGPSDMRFQSMGHYDPSVTGLEVANYCAWRVSGLFQTLDPICVLGLCN